MSRWRRRLDYAFRALATGLCFTMFGLACIVASVTVFPLIRLTSPDDDATRRRVRRFIHYSYRGFIATWRALGVLSYEVHGAERLAAPGQLVVCNHPSLIDVLFIGAQMPQVDCIVKDALLRNPILAAPVRWAAYIPNSAPEHLIGNCVATLRSGNSLLVFPEGTRSVPGQPLKMKRGAAHIALASGCDLLPVTIVCRPSSLTKTDVWYRVPPQRPHWCLTVGEPIRLAPLLVPGEPPTRAARRVTAHLTEYFSARIAAAAPLPAVASPAAAHGRSAAVS
jgi:1-acyl-sn-glycerol-3-phosphate acyltransferase